MAITFAGKLLEGWVPDLKEPVEEGVIGVSVGILLTLGAISYSYEAIRSKKVHKSTSSANKDILLHFTNIPTNELERRISDIVKEYPVVSIDEGIYRQFLLFKKVCSTRLELAESLIKKEHVDMRKPIDFQSELKPFMVPYIVQGDEIINMDKIQSLYKLIDGIESRYGVSEQTYSKYLKEDIHRENHTEIINPNKNSIIQVPLFNKSGKMITIKSSELLTDFLSSDVLHRLNDAYNYISSWFNFTSDCDGTDGFLEELYDSLKDYNTYDDRVVLARNHPYNRAVDVLSGKPKLVHMYLVLPLECYCKTISKAAKYIILQG